MGQGDLECFFLNPEVDCVVVCDVDDATHRQGRRDLRAEARHEARHGEGLPPRARPQGRRCRARSPRPDHWHALPTVLACQAGKDVYVEKPLAKTIDEGRAMLEAAKRHQRVVQMGSQWRSCKHIVEAAEFVRSGKLGKVSIVRGWAYLDWLARHRQAGRLRRRRPASTTTCGSARRPSGPSTRTASTSTSAGSGTTPAA